MRNFPFPGYAELVWTRSAIRAGQRCGGVGKASTVWRQVATGDRWLRPVDPNRLLPFAPGNRCGGVVLPEDLSLAMDVIP